MKAFTDVNSKLNRYANLLMDLFLLNMLFIITSLPIMTIGSGLISLSSVSIEMIEGRVNSPSKSYISHFKHNLTRGILIQFFLMSILIILFSSSRLLFILPTISFVLVGTGLILGVIIYSFLCLYIFSYSARYENSFKGSLKVAFQLSMSHLKESFTMILVILTVISLGSLNIFWASLISFFFFFIGFSFSSLLNATITLKVFNQYTES
ncbi:DUF624 domain-containing protein [Marinilactibacillus sp. XAAS-LB27]|uniref:DUF624 domain-containing protein n=1 Tax=Marinilactibacillus sp. XAAS-LB27 TaxID=3114538 RepID=UPI002E189420|nr:DUF624 domain-containing protein [Marinilactibacillus sp. XAAS-LB27]